jgi:hypothetical protein
MSRVPVYTDSADTVNKAALTPMLKDETANFWKRPDLQVKFNSPGWKQKPDEITKIIALLSAFIKAPRKALIKHKYFPASTPFIFIAITLESND